MQENTSCLLAGHDDCGHVMEPYAKVINYSASCRMLYQTSIVTQKDEHCDWTVCKNMAGVLTWCFSIIKLNHPCQYKQPIHVHRLQNESDSDKMDIVFSYICNSPSAF